MGWNPGQAARRIGEGRVQMTHLRMAFTAEYWGKQAVVCRALENSTGCSVAQEFGTFDSWTEARVFAEKLNEGLGLSMEEAREIVTGAMLATSDVTRMGARKGFFREYAPVVVKARSLRVRCIFSQLRLARTYCYLTQCRPLEGRSLFLLEKAAKVLEFALHSLPNMGMSRQEAEDLIVLIGMLKAELQHISGANGS